MKSEMCVIKYTSNMLFNADLLDVLSEVYTGFTIPTALTKSALYKYFTNPKSVAYGHETTRPIDFVNSALDDEVFIKYACSSKESAEWFANVIDNEVSVDPFNITLEINTLLRLYLVMDDRIKIKSCLGLYIDCNVSDILYAFATIDQLRWLISTNPGCLCLDAKTICRKIGRLDVMKLLCETDRNVLDDIRIDGLFYRLQYSNKYDHRTLETIEWLIDTLKIEFDESEIARYSDISDDQYENDESTFQWLMVHHTDAVIDVCIIDIEPDRKKLIMPRLFEYFGKETIQMYFEKIDTQLPIAVIGERKIESIKYLYSLIGETIST